MRRQIFLAGVIVAYCALLSGCEDKKENPVILEPTLFPDTEIVSRNSDEIEETHGVIYEVDVNSTGKSIEFTFSGYMNWELEGASQAEKNGNFVDKIQEIAVGKYPPKNDPQYQWKKPKKNCPIVGPSRRSSNINCDKLDSDLSASLDKAAYFGYVLNSKKENWQFTRLPNPIKIFVSSNTEYYDNPYSVKPNASPVAGAKGQEGARAVFFSADAPKDMANGNDSKFSAAFNLYTEVISSDGNKSFVPIVIDPDVKWPGGND